MVWMAMGRVIGSIFLTCDELLRVEELVVGTSANFTNNCGLQVYEHCLDDRMPLEGSHRDYIHEMSEELTPGNVSTKTN